MSSGEGDVGTGTPDDGAVGGPWASLPEDLRNHPEIQQYQDLEGLAKAHVNQLDLIGRKGVIPPKDESPEELSRFYNALGRPEAPSGYDLKGIEVPEDLPWSHEVGLSMIKAMHDAGLTGSQVRTVLQKYINTQSEAYAGAMSAINSETEKVMDEFEREWGSSFEARKDLSRRAFKHAFGEDAELARSLRLAEGTLVVDHPVMIRAFARLGETMGEHALFGEKERVALTKMPEEAQAELAILEASDEYQKIAYDKNHPEFSALMARRKALYEQAYPNERGEQRA